MTDPSRRLDRGFAAFLFDMDGTILTSIAAAERVWAAWARRHGLDVAAFLPTIHGRRSVETVRRLELPGVDPEAEADAITRAEMEDVAGIHAIADADRFLAGLPGDRWAVVTSAPRALARRRLAAAGLPEPPLLIASEDVTNGKPAPDCFLLAAERLGVRAEDCLVFEDAPPGIAAAEAAGASVVVITATHAQPVETRHPSIARFDQLAVRLDEAGRLSVSVNPLTWRRNMDVLYTAVATATGGRQGRVHSSDGVLDLALAMPKELGGMGGEATNPEQLFAAGYAACFENAVLRVARERKAPIRESSVTARVGIGREASGFFNLVVALEVTVPGRDRAEIEEIVRVAHEEVCPYSRATRGNIRVEVGVV